MEQYIKANNQQQTPRNYKRHKNMKTIDKQEIARPRIGQTKLKHKYVFEKGNPPICNICNKQLIVLHILLPKTRKEALRDVEANIKTLYNT